MAPSGVGTLIKELLIMVIIAVTVSVTVKHILKKIILNSGCLIFHFIYFFAGLKLF